MTCQHVRVAAIVRVVVAKCLIAMPVAIVREETVIFQSAQFFANVVVKAVVTCLLAQVGVTAVVGTASKELVQPIVSVTEEAVTSCHAVVNVAVTEEAVTNRHALVDVGMVAQEFSIMYSWLSLRLFLLGSCFGKSKCNPRKESCLSSL